jgi:hypothetical protein
MSLSGQSRWAKSIRSDAAACEKARVIGTALYGLLKFCEKWIDTGIGVARKKLGKKLTR